MVTATVKTIPVKHCNFEAKVKTAGSGPPLLYLHAAGGPIWDPFIEGLCERYTVYAPHHPGTGETARDAIYSVENLWDLLLIYEEILDRLGLKSVPVIGTSFGGMMACELAAHQPHRHDAGYAAEGHRAVAVQDTQLGAAEGAGVSF